MEGLMKKSFWIKLFLSYLAILAFSLAIGMFLFVSSLRRIKEKSMEQELAEEFGVTMDQLEGWLEEGDGFAVRFLGKRVVASKAIAVVRGGRNYTGEAPFIIMELHLSAWLDILTGGNEPAVAHDAVFGWRLEMSPSAWRRREPMTLCGLSPGAGRPERAGP